MNIKNYILEGARVIDPVKNKDAIEDIGISEGKICKPEDVENPQRLNLKGLVIAPGFIDIHVHLREPGGKAKETIKTGTAAAAAGGFTAILAMPNTKPATDNAGAVEYIKRHSEQNSWVNVLTAGCMTKGREGKDMAGIGGLKKAGISAITDDGACVQNHELMKHIIEYSKTFGMPILEHCEEQHLACDGLVHDGYWGAINGLKGIPPASEVIILVRDIILADQADWKIHIQHVSSAESIRYIKEAKERGSNITAEVTPHHLVLTENSIEEFDTNYKVNPPLRSEEDREALIHALQDDTISTIATDHAPHTETEKMQEFAYAPFGIIGLETAIPVCLTELYHKEILTLPQLISKFTKGPAEVLGSERGTINEGKAANLTILDPELETILDKKKFFSKSKNTPFDGMETKGKAVGTVVNGKFVYSEIPDVEGIL